MLAEFSLRAVAVYTNERRNAVDSGRRLWRAAQGMERGAAEAELNRGFATYPGEWLLKSGGGNNFSATGWPREDWSEAGGSGISNRLRSVRGY